MSMSRSSQKEYLSQMKRIYRHKPDRAKRGQLLDEACRMTGLERKYVNKILLGHRAYRENPARGKSYTPSPGKWMGRPGKASVANAGAHPTTLQAPAGHGTGI